MPHIHPYDSEGYGDMEHKELLRNPQLDHRWRVYKNGKDIGIIETNYVFASRFWGEIGKFNGAFYMLRLIQF